MDEACECKNPEIPIVQSRAIWFVAVGGAVIVAFGLFMIIPLTQLFDERPEADLLVREVSVVTLPPPEFSPPPSERDESLEEFAFAREAAEVPAVEIQRLEVSLAPGIGDAMAIGLASLDFGFEAELVSAIDDLFTFEDLDEVPRLVNMPSFRFPKALVRRGVTEGQVVVEIDIMPDGRARFRRIVSSTARELEEGARKFVEEARFTTPIVGGRAQAVRGNFPLLLSQ